MSYILDALRRAQTERELGQVPAVGGALCDAGTDPAPRGDPGKAWRRAAGGLALLLLASGAAWVWQQRAAEPVAAAPVPAGVAHPATAATPGPLRSATPVDAAPVAAAPPVLPPELPAPAPAAPALPMPASPRAAAAPPAAPAADAPIAFESLDAPTRARLPRLSLGGTIDASERSQRMVILDGQVLREGEAVVPGLTVETIDAQGVLLRLDERFGAPRRVRLRP